MKCKNCNKEVKKGNKFCNQSCAATYNNKKRKGYKSKTFICLNCGKEKIVEKNCKGKFCSLKCNGEYRRQLNIEKWKENKIKKLTRSIRIYILEKYNYKCSKCGWGETNTYTNTIPLDVEHIDGNSENNVEENLTTLCPNCHSLTSTYKGANKGNGRYSRKQRYKNGQSY